MRLLRCLLFPLCAPARRLPPCQTLPQQRPLLHALSRDHLLQAAPLQDAISKLPRNATVHISNIAFSMGYCRCRSISQGDVT